MLRPESRSSWFRSLPVATSDPTAEKQAKLLGGGYVLTVRMNNSAARVLRPPLGVDLAPELRQLARRGIVRRAGAVMLAGRRGQPPPGQLGDLTGWECRVNSFHLEDLVPVKVRVTDGQPAIDVHCQRELLQQGLTLGWELCELGRGLPEPVALRCITGVSDSNGTFRFHRIRPGQEWLHPDLDAYLLERMVVVESALP